MGGTPPPPRGPGARLPDLETVFTFNPDGSRNFLHPADVSGRWQVRKNLVFALLIGIYALLPWVNVGGHPAVLVDIPRRQAFLFGRTFTGEDFYLLFFVISGLGFGLIVLTALWGRIGCGFACPQTVFLEGVFRKIERLLEGPRDVRIRRNLGPTTADKAWRKVVKHAIFVALSLVVAHVFIAYFIPVRELVRVVRSSPAEHWTAFLWVAGMTGVLYFDFAWFREQTCLVVCPYGRLQSALIDDDTVIIGYDVKRGEPRTKTTDRGGDCIDCRRCVVVCPTGIDIRNGLQMECVGCANCIDACDEIMTRIDRPRGLVRYDSKRGFEGVRRRFLRPRVLLYAVLGLVGLAVFGAAAWRRQPFQAHALRTRGMPYVIEEGRIRNLFNLRVQNKEDAARTYSIRVLAGSPGDPHPEIVVAQPDLTLDAFRDATVPVFALLPRDRYTGPFAIRLVVRESSSGHEIEVDLGFLGP